MNITATMVKELRDKTGAGMMDAKKALVEVDGDMEKAMEVLRQKGIYLLIRKWAELQQKVELLLISLTVSVLW